MESNRDLLLWGVSRRARHEDGQEERQRPIDHAVVVRQVNPLTVISVAQILAREEVISCLMKDRRRWKSQTINKNQTAEEKVLESV